MPPGFSNFQIKCAEVSLCGYCTPEPVQDVNEEKRNRLTYLSANPLALFVFERKLQEKCALDGGKIVVGHQGKDYFA
jgi:hypothetical protein